MVKNLFLVKNGQKGSHGCVKSEHLIWDLSITSLGSRAQCAPPPGSNMVDIAIKSIIL